MTPTPSVASDAPNLEGFDKEKVRSGPDNQPASSYPGIWKYPTNRDDPLRIPEDWLAAKRLDDDIGNLWRVRDSLYDLEPFIKKHPGGTQWIEMSRGTDITEIFISSHMVNVSNVEKVLAKYYVKEATQPRITPFTMKEDGFYMTLKRRAEPILKKVGTGPTRQMTLFQDSLAASFLLLGVLASVWDSRLLAIVSGTVLGLLTIGGHNFFHLKENWRRYYFDLSFLSSYEWRITHSFSHHMYPNTLLDMEITAHPQFEYLPNRYKSWIQRNFSIFYAPVVYATGFWGDLSKRIFNVLAGRKKVRLENFLIVAELALFINVGATAWAGFVSWVIIHTVASFVLLFIGATVAHHHTTCFHDGDECLSDPDFGIGQLDATMDRAEPFFKNIFVTVVSFGHHPMHHLFPTVCHSKLPYLREIFEQTVREFKLDEIYPPIPQSELFLGTYQQLARTQIKRR